MPCRTLIIAHGGFSSDYPTNTLPAIKAAIELNVDYVEVDLNLSKDGEVIVIHDGTVDRTTDGSGRVRELTLSELKALDAGSWFHEKFTGVSTSPLEEIIPLFKTSQTRLCLEIKLDIGGRPYKGMESKVVDLLKKHDMLDKFIITSFNKDVLRQIKALHPSLPTSYDPSNEEYETCSPRKLCLSTLSCGSHIMSCRHEVIDETFLSESRLLCVSIWAWTVNDLDRMRRLLALGVEGILTDNPGLLQRVISD